MRHIHSLVAFGVLFCSAAAQEPQTTQRSVRNAVTMQAAPANVAPGGILAILGTDLAAAHTIAESYPLPLALEDPAVEVLINGAVAPLFFVSPTQVNAQVPWETETGWARVIVRRGGVESSAMPVNIVAAGPNLFTAEGSSSLIVQSGDADGGVPLPLAGPAPAQDVASAEPLAPGDTISVFAAGLGQPDSPVDNGALGSGVSPAAQQRAYLSGTPLEITSATLSEETAGVYELRFKVPESGELGEVLHWYSGNPGGRAVLGSVGPPTPRYMAVPAELESPQRIDMSELNPYFVAVSGVLDEEVDFCYANVQLLDFRRETAQTLEPCILPTDPGADGNYRPFEVALNTPVLAGLPSVEGDFEGLTNQLVLIDTSSDSPVQTVTLTNPADRLQRSGFDNPVLRLLRHDRENVYSLVNPDGTEAGEAEGWAPIANPPEVPGLEGYTRVVAQGAFSQAWGGYRMRFLGPGAELESGRPTAVLFDRDANVAAQASFPDGWDPVSPPRRLNLQGSPVGGASIAPAGTGFRGDASVFVVARSADGTRDAVVTFRITLPEEGSAEPPDSIPMEVSVTEFPTGSHAATCHPQVRWQRIPLTSSLAIVASSEVRTEFASPQLNQICTGDQLVVFDTSTSAIKAVAAPGLLDNGAKGAVLSYLYFAGGGREVALQAPQRLYVFDGVEETFNSIEFPDDVGITVANGLQVQRIGWNGHLVALATGGPTRTNPRTGAEQPPIPGNRGLLDVDLSQATFTHLALPEGYQNVYAGPNTLFQQGRRTFGVLPMIGRAFAIGRRPNAGPGNPGGSAILTWDIATGEATELPVPEDGLFVGQRLGGGRGGPPRPFLWDYRPKSESFAYGVFNRRGATIAIGVVGP